MGNIFIPLPLTLLLFDGGVYLPFNKGNQLNLRNSSYSSDDLKNILYGELMDKISYSVAFKKPLQAI